MTSQGLSLLLDTNVLLAALIAPDTLPTRTQQALRDPAVTVHFSAASLWEIAIKCSLSRQDFTFRPEDIELLARETGFTELPVLSQHTHAVATLPWLHRDPFDRLLLAQAISLPARLLTTDALLAKYSDLVQLV
jgi:PIN domain nuclease of toxin-antitoxin system